MATTKFLCTLLVLFLSLLLIVSNVTATAGGKPSQNRGRRNCPCNTNRWVPLGSDLNPSRRNSAVLENDCEILLFGGLNGPVPNTVPSVASLDSTLPRPQQEFTILGDLADDMNGPWFPTTKASFILDDEIYITCEDAADGKIWKYDRDSNSFETINEDNRMPFPSEDCCAFGFDGKIYVFAGQRGGVSYDKVQIYDVQNDVWTEGASMNVAREDMGCAAVSDQYVYLFGGAQGETVLGSVEKYDVAADSWTFFEEGALNPARRSLSAAYIPDTNEILLVGGDFCFDQGACPTDGSNFLSDIEVWNTDSDEIDDTLSAKYPSLVQARGGLAVALIDNNECFRRCRKGKEKSLTIYAIGGEDVLDETPWSGVETLCYKYS